MFGFRQGRIKAGWDVKRRNGGLGGGKSEGARLTTELDGWTVLRWSAAEGCLGSNSGTVVSMTCAGHGLVFSSDRVRVGDEIASPHSNILQYGLQL